MIDLYDDDDYYDDYEEEELSVKKKPQNKPQQTNVKNNQQNQKNISTNKNTNSSAIGSKIQPTKVQNNKNSPIKETKVASKTDSLSENKININQTIPKQINIESKAKKSISELNTIKYPKIDYKISEDEKTKPDINIVIIGHVDSGKSTLMGHLLYLQGEVSDKTLQKYEKESKKLGKNTFHFAWAMDEGTEERKRGVTVDIAYKNFETEKKKVTAMDAPGHRDFIPNMITGTSAADAALLVIDSNKNAFESGFFLGGQTKEHAVLARSLGVKQLIVCVNKLELMDWSQDRYIYIEAQVRDFLNSLDYKDEDIFFCPVSGLLGTNMITRDTKTVALQWYEGPSLISLIDNLEEPARDNTSPVRLSIADCGQTTINSLQGPGVFGKLQSGVVFEDEEYLILPIGIKVKIRSLTVDNVKSSLVKAGQSGELLINADKLVAEDIRPGNVLCSVDYPVPVVSTIRAQILTLDLKAPLNIGQMIFLHSLNQKTQAKIKKIEKIFSRDGKTTKNNTVFVPKNFNAFVVLELEDKVCLELYSNFKTLGRITLRASGETIAAGIVLEFLN